jgi:hypothetical protein
MHRTWSSPRSVGLQEQRRCEISTHAQSISQPICTSRESESHVANHGPQCQAHRPLSRRQNRRLSALLVHHPTTPWLPYPHEAWRPTFLPRPPRIRTTRYPLNPAMSLSSQSRPHSHHPPTLDHGRSPSTPPRGLRASQCYGAATAATRTPL